MRRFRQYVKCIQRAYNTCPNPALAHHSPHYILFGEEDRLLFTKNDMPLNHEDRLYQIKKLEEFRREIPELLRGAFEKYRTYHNIKHKEINLEIGDKVLLLAPIHRTKLAPYYIGPYTITKKLSKVSYIIDKDGAEEIVHASRIKKYHERKPP